MNVYVNHRVQLLRSTKIQVYSRIKAAYNIISRASRFREIYHNIERIYYDTMLIMFLNLSPLKLGRLMSKLITN